MKKYILSSIAIAFFSFASAQVTIGNSLNNIADKNQILNIKPEEGQKVGILLPRASSEKLFPNVVSESVNGIVYEPTPAMKGGLLYNERTKSYYKFDGDVWTQSNQLSLLHNPFVSRLRGSESRTAICGGGECLIKESLPLISEKIPSDFLVDNLEIGSNPASTTVEIKKTGLYNVMGVIGINGIGVSAKFDGEVSGTVIIDAQYPDSKDDWITISNKYMYAHSKLFDLGNDRALSTSIYTYLPAGTKLKMYFDLNVDEGIFIDAGAYASSTESGRTYLLVNLLKEY